MQTSLSATCHLALQSHSCTICSAQKLSVQCCLSRAHLQQIFSWVRVCFQYCAKPSLQLNKRKKLSLLRLSQCLTQPCALLCCKKRTQKPQQTFLCNNFFFSATRKQRMP